jgi:hypothetical protein
VLKNACVSCHSDPERSEGEESRSEEKWLTRFLVVCGSSERQSKGVFQHPARKGKSNMEKSELCFTIVTPSLINAHHPLTPSLATEGNYTLPSSAEEGAGGWWDTED